MKSMKIRKLAALGVAAAMAAAPVAFAATHFENLPTSRDWYFQSQIVVGKNAIASDVVAAADIAAAIATLAYKKAEIQGGSVEDAKVKLAVSGQIVVGENGYAPDNGVAVEFGDSDAGTIAVGPTEAPKLFKHQDVKYTYYDSTTSDTKEETVTMDEGVQFNADFEYYKNTDADKVYPVMNVSNIEYTIQFAPGIKMGLDRDNNDLDLVIPIFGKDYTVSKVGTDGSITFITAGDEKTLEVGQEYEFQGHTVKLEDISEDGKSAMVSVDGVVDTIDAGKTKTINGVKIYVKNVFNGVSKDSATLSLGAEEKTYNNGDQWDDLDNWQIEISNDGTYITGIKIKYVGSALTGEDALKEGDKFQIADSDLYVSFYGHDNYTDKEIEFDTDSVKVPYYSVGTVDLPYVKEVALPASGGTAIVNLGSISFKIKNNSGNYEITEYKYPGMSDYESATSSTIDASGDLVIDYANASSSDVVKFNIDRDTLKTMEITYTAVFDNNTSPTKVTFYIDSVGNGSDHVVSKDRTISIAKVGSDLQVTTDTGEYVAVPVDFTADELNVDDLGVTYNYGAGSETFKPADYTEFYTEEFDKVELSDNSVKIYVGVKPAKAYPWVGIPAQSMEAENVYEKKVGETLSVGDYEIKIEGIEGVANVEGTYYEKLNFDPIGMTVLDSEAGNGNLIVVGGWNANAIAAKIKEANPDIESELEQDKEIINKYTVDGQEIILVAGWEAQDTRKAAQDFANWLIQNVQ